MDTNSLCLALAGRKLYNCIPSEKKQELPSTHFNDSLHAGACSNLFPRTCCVKHKEHDKKEPGLCKEGLRRTEML